MSSLDTVYYVACSIDGFIADKDGGVGWLDRIQHEDYGYDQFEESVRTVVLGRATYDQVLTFGAYPYSSKRTIVLTHTPLHDPPPNTIAHTGRV